MVRIRRDHEPPPSQGKQVVSPHHPQHPLVITFHYSPAQIRPNSPIAIAPAMLQGDLLNRRPHLCLFLSWSLLLQRSVEARSTDAGQLTPALHTQPPVQGHHFSDLLVDAVS